MVDETEGPKFKTGIASDQLSAEAAASLAIQGQRQATDPHMKLQINRAGEKGDIESLSPDEQTQLFNPDGTHTAQVVQARVINYQAEHSRMAMPVGQERPQKRAAGVDSSGQHRMPGDGEALDQHGKIVMVDPQYAEESAERMKQVSEADAKNLLARNGAINQLCAALSTRPNDPAGALYCNWEESRAYIRIYQDQHAAGIKDVDVDFLPMRQYVNKFREVHGRMIPRPFLPNEIGVFQYGVSRGKILCLNDKNLANTDLTVQVPVAPVAQGSPISSSPGSRVSGFQVRSSAPVSVSTQVRQQPSAVPPVLPTPPLPVVQPASTRMTPIVPRQGQGQGQMKSPGRTLPPPPKGFKS